MNRLQQFIYASLLMALPFLESLAQINVAVEVEHVSCSGLANACAEVVISGGTPPYEIVWDQGSNRITHCGFDAGEHSVMVKDAGSLEAFATFEVNEPEVFIAGFSSSSNVTCDGCNDGSVVLEFWGGTAPFTYYIDEVSFISNERTVEMSSVAAGQCNVSAYDANSCGSASAVIVGQPQ